MNSVEFDNSTPPEGQHCTEYECGTILRGLDDGRAYLRTDESGFPLVSLDTGTLWHDSSHTAENQLYLPIESTVTLN